MSRKKWSFLGSVILSGALAQTALATELSYKGHMKYHYENSNMDEGVSGYRVQDDHKFRLRTYFKFKTSDTLSFHFTPQVWGYFGNSNHPNIEAYEANLVWGLHDRLDLTLGRQVLDFGSGFIFGARDWRINGQTFDLANFSYKYSWGRTNLFYGKENNASLRSAIGDTVVYGLYNDWSFNKYFKNVGVYALGVNTDGGVEANTFGVRFNGDWTYAFYALETAFQGGSRDDDQNAYSALLGIGFLDRSYTFSVEYSLAQEQYEEMYPTKHSTLGLADIFARRNLQEIAFRLHAQPVDWFHAQLAYHMFSKAEENQTFYHYNGTAPETGSTTRDDSLGDEFDVVLNFVAHDNVDIQVGGAFFSPDTAYEQANGNNDSVTRVWLALGASF